MTAWSASTAAFSGPFESRESRDVRHLSLNRSLKMKRPAVVSFYGAGGKSTLMLKLAEELAALDHKIVVTTTTKIYPPANLPLILTPEVKTLLKKLEETLNNENIAVLGSMISTEGKIDGFVPEMVSIMSEAFNCFVLVEADGANSKPLKGYNHYEPILPKISSYALAIAGADVLGLEISEQFVHRADKFSAATGLNYGDPITVDTLSKAFRYMADIGKNQAPGAKFAAILNKVDLLCNPEDMAIQLSAGLAETDNPFSSLLLTTAFDENPVKFVLSTESKSAKANVAAIILAAGSSQRMGVDKLTLKLGERTVFEYTLREVLTAGADQVIVVTRTDSSIIALAEKEKCRVVINTYPEAGLSTSLKMGLNAVDSSCQGALFALGDQPLISAAIYRDLLERYRKTLRKIICPRYKGRRGNPTIFDRRTWPELMQLAGDQGGRSLIDALPENQVEYLEVNDPAIITDLDTPSDYKRLQQIIGENKF
jgi:molybdenum cofactor cytidylyltransferase/probable selenium-dependent hydroxylase accessory protein YqeC